MMSKLSAEQRIERTHVQLMKHKNFCLFSGLFMVGKVSVDDDTPTAKTNGLDVVYGRAFVDSLTDKALAFVILHENMHKAYRHLIVWENLHKKNAQLANAACDYVINLQIRDYDPEGHDVEMPIDADGNVMGLIDEKYRGMDTAQVFALLYEEHGGGGGGGEKGFDEHDWEGAKEATPEEQAEIANEIERALRQGSILAGKMGGNVSRELQDLMTPKIDWKEALRDFVKTTTQGKDQTTWRRLHKRYIASDLIMPSSYDEKVGAILVGIDTSGSIGGEELAGFLSEVKSICDEVCPEKIDLLYWDTRVAGHETYQGAELCSLVESTQAKGGGGTDPDCVPAYMKKENLVPECVIMLTDGYINSDIGNWSSVTMPTMWCIKGNSRFDSGSVIGKVVHVE
jgi:predicted metal-dependent peptidase